MCPLPPRSPLFPYTTLFRSEGTLMIYSSMTVPDMGAIMAAFTAKYGVRAQHWRGSSEDIRNRVTREYAANRFDARSEEHTSELQSLRHLVCRLLLEKNTKTT